MKHAVEHLRFPEAAVEAVTEFCQITGQMLGADAMMDATNIAFDIGDQSMNPRQDFRRFLPRTGDQPLVTESGRGIQEAVALPAVSLDHRLGRQALPYQGLNLCAADPGNQMHGGKSGLVVRRLYSDHHLGLAGRTSAALAGLGSPEVSVVHLDQAREFIIGIPVRQGLANLVAHSPHGFIALDLQHPLQRRHGDAALLAPHQPDHPEPFSQGSPRLMKYGTGGQRSLVTAGLALI